MSNRVLACVSSHGFGHFVQTAQVLNQFKQNQPQAKIIIKTGLPIAFMQDYLDFEFEHICKDADFGMRMQSAIDVDTKASLAAYEKLHSNYAERLQQEKEIIRALQPDLVLANIPYLSVHAAAELSLPVIAMCSLNWAHIFQSFYNNTQARAIFEQMLAAYNQANVFLRPEPSMAMPGLQNLRDIGPLARVRQNIRDQFVQQEKIASDDQLILVVPGGIPTDYPVQDWPAQPGRCWVISWEDQRTRADMLHWRELDADFTQVLSSVDVVVTKPGYGIVAETVCNQVPALFVRRGDWAEEPFLIEWWQRQGRVLEIDRSQFFHGQIDKAITEVLQSPLKPRIESTGAIQAAGILEQYLS
jgi:UDP-N-acetylglucosamine:LPS N-acetylglucosamine transferase